MATCLQIITRSLQKLGIVGASGTANAADQNLGLQALRALFQKLITAGAFGSLIDVIPSNTQYEAGENERVMHDGSVTVVLPDVVPMYYTAGDYGRTSFDADNLNVRPPRDLSVISVVNTATGVIKDYIYDSRLRQWIDINALTTSSICPLAHRDENGLSAMLAVHVSDEFGQKATPLMIKAAYEYQTALSHNWSQAGEVINPRDYY